MGTPPARGIPPRAVWQAKQSPIWARYSPCRIVSALGRTEVGAAETGDGGRTNPKPAPITRRRNTRDSHRSFENRAVGCITFFPFRKMGRSGVNASSRFSRSTRESGAQDHGSPDSFQKKSQPDRWPSPGADFEPLQAEKKPTMRQRKRRKCEPCAGMKKGRRGDEKTMGQHGSVTPRWPNNPASISGLCG